MAKVTSALRATIQKNIEQGKTFREIAALTGSQKVQSAMKSKNILTRMEYTMPSELIGSPRKKHMRKTKIVSS